MLFRLELDTKSPACGQTRRQELFAIEQILLNIAKNFGLGQGSPPLGGKDGSRLIMDGQGTIIGKYWFGDESLFAPGAVAPQFSEPQMRVVLPHAIRVASRAAG